MKVKYKVFYTDSLLVGSEEFYCQGYNSVFYNMKLYAAHVEYDNIILENTISFIDVYNYYRKQNIMKPKSYIKKPQEVLALQFVYSEEGIAALKEFCGTALGKISKDRHPTAVGQAEIKTLEDGTDKFKVVHIASEGDYIVHGNFGEFWPVKQHIFESTYQLLQIK